LATIHWWAGEPDLSVVPPLNVHTTAEIAESGVTCTSPNVVTCYTSQITIPGTFGASPYLTIRLSQDISNIRLVRVCGYRDGTDRDEDDWFCVTKRVPIEQISIVYVPDSGTVPAPSVVLNLQPTRDGICTPPTDGRPCLAWREVIKNGAGSPIRYEWILYNRKNGGYKVQ